MSRRRMYLVLAIAIASVVFSILYAVRARQRAGEVARKESGVVRDPAALAAVTERRHILMRATRLGVGSGNMVAVAAADPTGVRYDANLPCERIAAAPRGGVCLSAQRKMVATYEALVFDNAFSVQHRITLAGVPSRVKVSPDGRLAGVTVFVSGHAYSDGGFSTQTTIIDLDKGSTLAELETFEVRRNGQLFRNADFNFWGVTFARDSKTFYATLGTGKELLLVKADPASKQATVVAEGVECPSISPDNRRIAFKKRVIVDNQMIWRLAVLDLETNAQRVIDGERRSVDDQVEWLDNQRILYALSDDRPGSGSSSVWMVDVEQGPAVLWTDGAYSPSVAEGAGAAR